MPGGFIGYLLDRGKEQEQEEKDRARKFKALVEYGDAAGLITKDKAMTMDLDSLEGALKGYAYKSVRDEQEQRAAEISSARKQREDADAQVSPAVGYYADAIAPGRPSMTQLAEYYGKQFSSEADDSPYPVGAPRLSREAATAEMFQRFPLAASSPQFDNAMKLLQYGKEKDDAGKWNLQPDKPRDFGGGIKGYPQSPNSWQFFQTPERIGETEKARTENRPQRGSITDKDRFEALQAHKRVLATARTKTTVPREQAAYDLAIGKIDEDLAQLDGGAPAAEAKVPEAPPDAKQRVAGTTYQTPKGPLKWTGTGWVKP